MTDDPTPTTQRRELGLRLREIRQARGKTPQDLSEGLGFSLSKISRMETGARAVSEEDIAKLTDFLEVDGETADQLRGIATSARRRRTLASFPAASEFEHLKIVQSGFVELERDASAVREFNTGVVPGLLQTEPYMHAQMVAVSPDDTSAARSAIDVRLARKKHLERLESYAVIIDEAVLARVVGGEAVMAGQADAIMKCMADGNVNLNVIPFSAGCHPGSNSMFVALAIGSATSYDVVFVEGLVGHHRIEKPEEAARFDRVWAELLRVAAPAEKSWELVAEYARTYAKAAGLPF